MEKEKSMPQKRRVTRRKEVPMTREPLHVNPDARRRMIEDAAYFRYEKRSGNGGDHVEDWLLAEAEIEAMLSGKSA